ncbi:MAG: hypothetical protein WC570_00810 [Patescibacteria group bacterium]
MKKTKDNNRIDFRNYKAYFDNLNDILPSKELAELAKTLKDYEKREQEVSTAIKNLTDPLVSLGYELDKLEEQYDGILDIKISNLLESQYSASKIKNFFNKKLQKNKRKHIINKAVQAHFDTNFILSIPVLLTQIDGLFFEIHISVPKDIKGYTAICDECMTKLCKECAKKNQRQKPTIRNIIQYLSKKENEFTNNKVLFDVIEDVFGEFRNDILHGRKIDYANKELSSRLILILMNITNNL